MNGIIYVAYLLHIKLAGKHHHIGKLRVEAHSLYVGYVALSGDMHLHTVAAAALDYGNVGSDDCRHTRGSSGADDGLDMFEVVFVYDSIDSKICTHPGYRTLRYNGTEVVQSKIGTRARTHVKTLHTEVNCIGTGIYSSREGVETAYGRHYLEIASFI